MKRLSSAPALRGTTLIKMGRALKHDWLLFESRTKIKMVLSFCHWGSKTTQASSCNWIVDGTLHFGNHSGVSYIISSLTFQGIMRIQSQYANTAPEGREKETTTSSLCFLVLIFWHRAPPQTQPNRKAAGWWPLRRNFYSSSFHFFYFTSSAVSGIEPRALHVLENSPVFRPKWRLGWTDTLQASPQRVHVQLWRSLCTSRHGCWEANSSKSIKCSYGWAAVPLP